MSKKEKKSNIKIAFYFFSVVFFFIVLSLIVRGVFLLKESKFDNKHQFNLLIKGQEKTSRVISLNPSNLSMSDVIFVDATNLKASLLIPIDSEITSTKDLKSSDVSGLFQNLLFDYKNSTSDLTIVDIARITFFAKRVSQKDISKTMITGNLDEVKASRLINSYFLDKTLIAEKTSVKITNATKINGLGGKIAKIIGNIGGNVVEVSTSDKIEKESSLKYLGKKSYTIERLEKILSLKGIPIEEDSIADIIVVLGEDLKNIK